MAAQCLRIHPDPAQLAQSDSASGNELLLKDAHFIPMHHESFIMRFSQ